MAFVTIEDLYGTAEVIVFDSCYAKCSDILLADNIVLVDGKLSIREDEDAKIVANNIKDFNDYINNAEHKILYESNKSRNEIQTSNIAEIRSTVSANKL